MSTELGLRARVMWLCSILVATQRLHVYPDIPDINNGNFQLRSQKKSITEI